MAGSLFGNNLSNGNVYDKNQLNAVEYISGQKITSELIENSKIANKVAKEDRENYLLPVEKLELVRELDNNKGDINKTIKIWQKYSKISNVRDKDFNKAINACKSGNCNKMKEIHYDLRLKLTKQGNQYFTNNKDEFVLLPESKAKFHTYMRNPDTGEVMDVLKYAEKGYTKYVHPIMGYEVVKDAQGNIVTNPLNIGTYNFYNPYLGENNRLLEDNQGVVGMLLGRHAHFDVKPYFMLGNSEFPIDPTSEEQRKARLRY